MSPRSLFMVAAITGLLAPNLARGDDGDADAPTIAVRVLKLKAAGEYAAAAKLAAAAAAREDLPDADRVQLGGLARQNFELSYEAGGPLTDLCALARVMREVAELDTAEGKVAKIKAAEDAEAKLERAAGPGWRAACSPEETTAAGKAQQAADEVPAAVVADAPVAPATATSEPRRGDAAPSGDRTRRRRVHAGVGTLVSGVVLLAPMAGVLAYRKAGEDELWSLWAARAGRAPILAEAERAADLNRRHQDTTVGAAVLGVTSAALVVTGVVLLATGGRQSRMAVAPWGGRGIGGLVLEGRF